MTDLRFMPPLGCENDVGGRFTVCPVPDSHGTRRVSAEAAVSYALRGPAGRGRTGRSGGDGSDPPVRGPGAGSDAGVFSHPCPRPLGSLPIHQSLRGKAV